MMSTTGSGRIQNQADGQATGKHSRTIMAESDGRDPAATRSTEQIISNPRIDRKCAGNHLEPAEELVWAPKITTPRLRFPPKPAICC